MTKNTPADDRTTVTLAAWERPSIVRLDAADAEMMAVATFPDDNGMLMVNS